MTQQEEQLLLKDLCARLPYGVKVDVNFYYATKELSCDLIQDLFLGEKSLRPYLRPMSSMTKEEEQSYEAAIGKDNTLFESFDTYPIACVGFNATDWLLKYHFDYRGLIPMGLALEAKEGMYKTE